MQNDILNQTKVMVLVVAKEITFKGLLTAGQLNAQKSTVTEFL